MLKDQFSEDQLAFSLLHLQSIYEYQVVHRGQVRWKACYVEA